MQTRLSSSSFRPSSGEDVSTVGGWRLLVYSNCKDTGWLWEVFVICYWMLLALKLVVLIKNMSVGHCSSQTVVQRANAHEHLSMVDSTLSGIFVRIFEEIWRVNISSAWCTCWKLANNISQVHLLYVVVIVCVAVIKTVFVFFKIFENNNKKCPY